MSTRADRLALPAYFVASLLILFPLVDTAAGWRPLNPLDLQWRFGVVGLASQALLTPLLGMLLLQAIASYAKHARIQRVLGVLAWTFSIVCLAASALFTLDALSVRNLIDDEARSAYYISYVVALGKYLIVAGVAALLGRAGMPTR